MKILRVYPFLPPLPGGLEQHVARLTREQRQIGCDVTVAYNRGDPTSETDIRLLEHVNLRNMRPQALRDFLFYTALVCELWARPRRFDVIHIHGDWSAFLFGLVMRGLCRARLLTATVHGRLRRGLHAVLYRRILRSYQVVYCTGARDAAYLRKVGVASARWQHSGIDWQHFSKDKGSDAMKAMPADIVCVATFLPVKNLALAIDIAALMPMRRFVFVGDGPERERLEKQCVRCGVQNVIFTGRLTASEIGEQLRCCRVFLSTSFSEGTPTSMLEAMACGLPVVTSSSNDYTGLVDEGQHGFVLNTFSANDYVTVLETLLSNEALICSIGAANTDKGKAYAWPQVAQQITEWMLDEK